MYGVIIWKSAMGGDVVTEGGRMLEWIHRWNESNNGEHGGQVMEGKGRRNEGSGRA